MSDHKIMHRGTVEHIEGHHIVVRIERSSACSSCRVAGRCNAYGSHPQLIDVSTAEAEDLHEGDGVTVSTSVSTARSAVVWGFVLPLAVLVVAIAVTHQLSDDDGLSAIIGLLALLPYYMVLYLTRDRLRKRLSFHLEHAC